MKHFALSKGQSSRLAIGLVLLSSVSSVLKFIGITGVVRSLLRRLNPYFCIAQISHFIEFRV
jgi:hypothetical protein